MSRYINTQIIKDDNGKRKLATTIVPVIPISQFDTYIQTTTIERLDKLAYTFYQDESLWWIIATANGLGKGSYIVAANTTLRIPNKDGVTDYVVALNRAR
jgi:hypothetical protein